MAEKEWNPIIGQKPRRVAFSLLLFFSLLFFSYFASCVFFFLNQDPGRRLYFNFEQRDVIENRKRWPIYLYTVPFIKYATLTESERTDGRTDGRARRFVTRMAPASRYPIVNVRLINYVSDRKA